MVSYDLPNADVRCILLNELGRGLLDKYDGSALSMICKANGSADALVGIILDTFPGFRDYAIVDGDGDGPGDDDDDVDGSSSEWERAKGGTRSVVHFYKRAQIVVADLWAALGRRHRGGPLTAPSLESRAGGVCYPSGMCQFHDIDLLTTFPDYRVPQILRHVNVLRYDPTLEKMVDGRIPMEKGGIDEISIRAGTVMAVEEVGRPAS